MDDPKLASDWRRGILANRRRFILLFGVVGWGVPAATLLALYLQSRKGFQPGWYQTSSFLGTLGISLLVFGIGGVFAGAYVLERFVERASATAAGRQNGGRS